MKVKILAGKTAEFEGMANKWLQDENPGVKSVGLAVNPSGIWLTALIFYEEQTGSGEASPLNG
jgi:hypothetical protein